MSKPKGLTDEQKAAIKADFREWSGGYHPGEAADESESYVEEWKETYGEEALEDFLQAWGEEETAKDLAQAEKDEAKRKADLKERFLEIAKSCVRMNDDRTAVMIVVEDGLIKLPTHKTKTAAKAEWADVLWFVQKLLERGAEEADK